MTPSDILTITREGLLLVLWASLPIVLVSTFTALAVATLQTVTQIQDQSISQSVRQIAVMLTVVVTAGWAGRQILGFAERALQVVSTLP